MSSLVQYSSRRIKTLRFFQRDFGVLAKAGSLRMVALPQHTAELVGAIAAAKSTPRELVLLGLLAAIAAADRGRSRVVTRNGDVNTLSLLIHVGAESGCGKSRSLEIPLAILTEWEQKKQREVAEDNKKRKMTNRAIDAQIKRLALEFAKNNGDVRLEDLHELDAKKRKILPLPRIFLNDVTAAAYAQHLAEYGYAVRLESDGMALPKAAMRYATKAWTGETSCRTRVYAPDGVMRNPFIVDAVFTQPSFFYQHISDPDYLESGLMARTLPYRYEENLSPSSIDSYVRPMDEDLNVKLKEKLFDLLDASEYNENSERQHRIINVDPKAEDLLNHCNQKWKSEAEYGNKLYRVREFVARMPQHALRLAGCLYLIEHQKDSIMPISVSLMDTAIGMVEVFLSHVLRWTIKDYEDLNVECCRSIMLYVLEKNIRIVLEKELKQAIHHKFKAADVDIALEYLLSARHLYNRIQYRPISRAGRPAGREFENPYFDLDGSPF